MKLLQRLLKCSEWPRRPRMAQKTHEDYFAVTSVQKYSLSIHLLLTLRRKVLVFRRAQVAQQGKVWGGECCEVLIDAPWRERNKM